LPVGYRIEQEDMAIRQFESRKSAALSQQNQAKKMDKKKKRVFNHSSL
jgi:hypothetical protein